MKWTKICFLLGQFFFKKYKKTVPLVPCCKIPKISPHLAEGKMQPWVSGYHTRPTPSRGTWGQRVWLTLIPQRKFYGTWKKTWRYSHDICTNTNVTLISMKMSIWKKTRKNILLLQNKKPEDDFRLGKGWVHVCWQNESQTKRGIFSHGLVGCIIRVQESRRRLFRIQFRSDRASYNFLNGHLEGGKHTG